MNALEIESEARRFAANEIARWVQNEPVRSENNLIFRGVREFTMRHAFPNEATIEGLFNEDHLPLFLYPLAQRLWDAEEKKERGGDVYRGPHCWTFVGLSREDVVALLARGLHPLRGGYCHRRKGEEWTAQACCSILQVCHRSNVARRKRLG